LLKKILELSWAYEFFQDLIGAKKFRRFYIREYVRPLPGMRIIDIGCGPGVIVPYLGDVEYYGIDLNPRYIEEASKKYQSDKIRFKCAGVASLGTSDIGSFDIAMMNGVLHHLSDAEIDSCMAAVQKLLKPGGRFCSFDGVYYDKITRLEKFVLDNDRGRFVRTPEDYSLLIKKYLPNARYVVKRDGTFIPNPLIIFY
jgi:SAM-dependent methyltransferase